MWKRFVRLMRSLMGLFISGMEDPKLLLRQAMEDLRNEIPRMNRQAAEIVKNEKMLDMQMERSIQNLAALKIQVEAAVKGGESTKQAALVLISQMQREEKHMEGLTSSLAVAKANSEKILKMRDAFEQKIRSQIDECRNQMSRAEMAQAEEQMANLMGTFKVADVGDTLDSVTDQIDERLARAQAKMQVAGDTADAQIANIGVQAETAVAESAYDEMRKQMGLDPIESSVGSGGTKTMGSIPVEECAVERDAQVVKSTG